MDIKQKNELVGRLWLWAHSIDKTKELLIIAQRAALGKNQDFQISERDEYIKKLNEFVKQQPDYKTDTIFSSQQQKFDQIYPRQFPTWGECFQIYDACIELAIIYFCQIFNFAHGEEGTASSNATRFRNEHFLAILNKVFTNNDDLEKFNKLKDVIVTARNKMIGHADANAYSIRHRTPVSTMKGPKNIWSNID